MMHSKHNGIIISSRMPFQPTFTVFDNTLGLIKTGSLRNNTLSVRLYHGMLIEYVPQEKGESYLLEAIQIKAVPSPWVSNNLVFFHELLRSLQEWLFFGTPHYELFNLLTILFEEEKIVFSRSFFPQWFCCRLLMLLDMYPSNYQSFDVSFFSLISSSFDIMVKMEYDETKCAHDFYCWLHRCAQEYPEIGKFILIFLHNGFGYEI